MRLLDLDPLRVDAWVTQLRRRGVSDGAIRGRLATLKHAELLAHRTEVAAAKRDRTYWRDRDARRAATRPIHVEVNSGVWQRTKLEALRRGTTLGEAVGDLVRAEVKSDGQTLGHDLGEVSLVRSDRGDQPGTGRRACVFARVAVEDEVWTEFKILAAERRLTVARAVGLLVERSAGAK